MKFPFFNVVIPFFNTTPAQVPVSVNWFPNRRCSSQCHFCFHTNTHQCILPLKDAKRGLRMLVDAGMRKLNISGREPFLQPCYIGEVFKFCKEELHIESCSVVNDGSKVTEKWLDTYGKYLDVMAISCDSFDVDTDTKQHIDNAFKVAQWAKDRGIKVKIDSVVTINNLQEDVNDQLERLAPCRWKVFQVLLLDTENTGTESGGLHDARNLVNTKEQFQAFLEARHASQKCLVPEDNEATKDSCLNLDERMRFLNCRDGGKAPGRSLLDVGVQDALRNLDFDERMFGARGGIFDWKRDPASLEL